MLSQPALSRGASRIVAVLGFLILLAILPPWMPSLPSPGLDPSWTMALQYGHNHGWHWGSDVVFTFGPLAFLYTKMYDPLTYGATLVLWMFMAVSAGIGLFAVVGRAGLLATIAAMLGLVISFDSPDVFFMSLPLLLTVVWCTEGRVLRAVALACLVLSIGLVTQIKLSALPLCLLSVVLIDFGRMVDRRFPVFTGFYLLAALAIWLLAGQNVGDLPAYIVSTADVIRGYDSAMQSYGARGETLYFVGIALVNIVLFGWGLISRRSRAPRHHRIIVALMGLAFLQVSFKAGFVRHDLHSLLSWLALCAGSSIFLLLPWTRPPLRALRYLALTLPLFPALGFAQVLHLGLGIPFEAGFGPLQSARLRAEVDAALKDFTVEQRAAYTASRSAALSKIAADSGFPKVDGTVDVMASTQMELLASENQYDPRPVFQDYVAYTPRLADLNKRFFESERAPAYTLFGISPLDNRYPASIDGSSWIALLARYQPLRIDGKYLVLGHRPSPAIVGFSPSVHRTIPFGEATPLWTAPDAQAVWATIHLSETWLGRLVHVVWKPPIVEMDIIGANGYPRPYRFVPGSGDAGFMLSPTVATNIDFLGLYLSNRSDAWLGVSQIRLRIPRWAKSLYEPQVDVGLSEMTLPPKVENQDLAALTKISDQVGVWRRLAATSPTAIVEADDLFAHAPSRMSMPSANIRSVSFQFGLKDGSWRQAGEVHGVTFKVSGENANGVHELWSRTLQPKTVIADQGVQTALATLQPGDVKLIFETIPLDGMSGWAWSYWGDISLQHGTGPG